ncbi:MAG: hypothetical protein GKR93_15510 [Gammaproteobacteria bacterium]|nr:hypothetical protein [Gammaproteobacteria bacterium]
MKNIFQIFLLIMVFSFNSQVFAEGKGKGGDEFRKTAESYEKKSEKYRAKGMSEVAALYSRQAEIKREAAAMGDEGRWGEIDWSEYHKNEGLINQKVKQTKTNTKPKRKSLKRAAMNSEKPQSRMIINRKCIAPKARLKSPVSIQGRLILSTMRQNWQMKVYGTRLTGPSITQMKPVSTS